MIFSMLRKIKTLRELVLLKKSGRPSLELCFEDNHEKANAKPIENKVIIWPSVYTKDSLEENSLTKADAFRLIGEPYRTLGIRNRELVEVRYHRLG